MLVEVALNVEILGALKPIVNYWWKMCIKTVNVGKGHLKHQNIMHFETSFKALIHTILTRPESHKKVQNSSMNSEKAV